MGLVEISIFAWQIWRLLRLPRRTMFGWKRCYRGVCCSNPACSTLVCVNSWSERCSWTRAGSFRYLVAEGDKSPSVWWPRLSPAKRAKLWSSFINVEDLWGSIYRGLRWSNGQVALQENMSRITSWIGSSLMKAMFFFTFSEIFTVFLADIVEISLRGILRSSQSCPLAHAVLEEGRGRHGIGCISSTRAGLYQTHLFPFWSRKEVRWLLHGITFYGKSLPCSNPCWAWLVSVRHLSTRRFRGGPLAMVGKAAETPRRGFSCARKKIICKIRSNKGWWYLEEYQISIL